MPRPRRRQRNQFVPRPLLLDTSIHTRQKFRFTCPNSGISEALDAQDVLGALGVFTTTTNTTCQTLFTSFLIHMIEIWTPPAAGQVASCSVDWFSSSSGEAEASAKLIVDTSNSPSYPAHIRTAPPRNTLASFWQNSASSNFCVINCPQYSIVEVEVSARIDGIVPANNAVSVTTCALGSFYFLALDGPANNGLIPVYLKTTH